ncbi:efflux RND transporter periplasmic adaptor subunit [Siphonobacter sp.]|uniref:efflux RND transporter periplasmic adaptor subunit n=1 Tax=Siphonobacter sp. TaxID=1869184 RepID=UPI003B3A6210
MKPKPYFSIGLAAFVLASCQSKPAPETAAADPAVPVLTQTVSRSSSDNQISISGNVEGNRTVKLGFLVGGKINYIAATEGQPVAAGKVLASLDPTSYRLGVDAATASVNQVQDEYNRLKLMHDRNSLSDADFAKVSNGLKQAQAQAGLQKKNLSDTKLYAPFSGVLLKKNTEIGEIVGSGMPLFIVSDIQKVKVNAAIPESELQRVKIGQSAQVYISALDSTFTGKVTEVGSAADATTRSFSVKIELRNPKLLIRPGMVAEVKLPSTQKTESLTLPAEAVLHDTDNSSYVFVADSQKKQAFKRRVSIGRLLDSTIEITSGLQPGELVITGGQQKIHDGSAIQLTNTQP